jgi:class 3 adenylate cyclase
MPENTKAELKRLLQERSRRPECAADIDAEIQAVFGVNRAVLVMDMTGFSRTTLAHGVIHFLTMIHRMNEIAQPVIERHGGELVKFEADNVFAVFITVDQAVVAACDLINCLEAANAALPDEMDMRGKFGIGYGEILLLRDGDLFGAEVNLASKLGENIAVTHEVLLTQAAGERLNLHSRRLLAQTRLISGVELSHFYLAPESDAAE